MITRGRQESWYDVAEVCLNGHSINRSTIAFPDFNADYCKSCGAGTIMVCPACEKPIPGDYHSPGVFSMHEPPPPPFCKYCGKPYPWTQAKLEAAREWASDLEKLNDRERELLAKSLDDLVVDVPMTRVSADRVKRLLVKAGGGAIEMFPDADGGRAQRGGEEGTFPLKTRFGRCRSRRLGNISSVIAGCICLTGGGVVGSVQMAGGERFCGASLS